MSSRADGRPWFPDDLSDLQKVSLEKGDHSTLARRSTCLAEHAAAQAAALPAAGSATKAPAHARRASMAPQATSAERLAV